MDIPVKIYYRRNARNFIARLNSDGSVRVTAPYGVAPERQQEIIADLVRKVREKAVILPGPCYTEGMTLECDGLTFRFRSADVSSAMLKASISRTDNHAEAVIEIPATLDTADRSVQKRISDLMVKVAANAGKKPLLEQAAAVSRRTGASPAAWKIGHGRRTLGTCHADRTITLSALLVFLPAELKEYIICHELAHLTEMNHSVRFHRLCDHYLGGREKQLAKAIKCHRWPILR